MLLKNLSDKDKLDLETTVEHYLVNDGYSVREATEEASFIVQDLTEGWISFTLWDALGCDDAGLIEVNPRLQKLLKSISKDIGESKNKLKH
jgi:hypothetical protein